MKVMDRFAYVVAGTALAGGVIALGPSGDGLEPPVGPVSDTSPSLADLQGGLSGGNQEWEVFTAPLSGAASNASGPLLVAEGRVLVHSLIAHRADLAVFDGPGQLDVSSTLVQSGDVVGRAYSYFNSGGSVHTEQIVLDVVVENGLYAGFWVQANSSHVAITYRRLP